MSTLDDVIYSKLKQTIVHVLSDSQHGHSGNGQKEKVFLLFEEKRVTAYVTFWKIVDDWKKSVLQADLEQDTYLHRANEIYNTFLVSDSLMDVLCSSDLSSNPYTSSVNGPCTSSVNGPCTSSVNGPYTSSVNGPCTSSGLFCTDPGFVAQVTEDLSSKNVSHTIFDPLQESALENIATAFFTEEIILFLGIQSELEEDQMTNDKSPEEAEEKDPFLGTGLLKENQKYQISSSALDTYVQDLDANMFRFEQLIKDKSLIYLLCHWGCNSANKILDELHQLKIHLNALNTSVLLIGNATWEKANIFYNENLQFLVKEEVYQDPSLVIYNRMNCTSLKKTPALGSKLPRKALKLISSMGYKSNGIISGDPYQLGGVWVSQNGKIIFEHIERFRGDHPSLADLLLACGASNDLVDSITIKRPSGLEHSLRDLFSSKLEFEKRDPPENKKEANNEKKDKDSYERKEAEKKEAEKKSMALYAKTLRRRSMGALGKNRVNQKFPFYGLTMSLPGPVIEIRQGPDIPSLTDDVAKKQSEPELDYLSPLPVEGSPRYRRRSVGATVRSKFRKPSIAVPSSTLTPGLFTSSTPPESTPEKIFPGGKKPKMTPISLDSSESNFLSTIHGLLSPKTGSPKTSTKLSRKDEIMAWRKSAGSVRSYLDMSSPKDSVMQIPGVFNSKHRTTVQDMFVMEVNQGGEDIYRTPPNNIPPIPKRTKRSSIRFHPKQMEDGTLVWDRGNYDLGDAGCEDFECLLEIDIKKQPRPKSENIKNYLVSSGNHKVQKDSDSDDPPSDTTCPTNPRQDKSPKKILKPSQRTSTSSFSSKSPSKHTKTKTDTNETSPIRNSRRNPGKTHHTPTLLSKSHKNESSGLGGAQLEGRGKEDEGHNGKMFESSLAPSRDKSRRRTMEHKMREKERERERLEKEERDVELEKESKEKNVELEKGGGKMKEEEQKKGQRKSKSQKLLGRLKKPNGKKITDD